MKILNLKAVTLLFVVSLFIISCNKGDSITEPIASDDAVAISESEDISDEVNNFIDDYFAEEESVIPGAYSGKAEANEMVCLTRTVVVDATTKTVTLDFGAGCETPNGNFISGKIIFSYAINRDAQSFTVSYIFENFFFNDLSVEGQNSIVRVKSNANGNPQSTVSVDIKVTWPDGNFALRKGTKVREWIAGYDTRTFGDNVFLITGNWSATFKNGTVISATILEPLRREMACRFLVSGIVELHKNERSGTLNFGDGSCDNIAVFTSESGETIEITLRGGRMN